MVSPTEYECQRCGIQVFQAAGDPMRAGHCLNCAIELHCEGYGYVRPTRRYPVVYARTRPDGWPFCPRCEEDELWGDAPPGASLTECIDAIAGCYRCHWRPGENPDVGPRLA